MTSLAPSVGTLYDGSVMIRLIVFLGNKGLKYSKTRHNVGWQFLADRSDSFAFANWQEKFHGLWAKGVFAQSPQYLLKPMTYMNESGRSVSAIAQYFSLEPAQILIVHDDVELDFRTIRLQMGGSLAGHNGLRSISSAIGSKDMFRLRVGVGRPTHGSVSSHVLGRFDEFEQAELQLVFLAMEQILEAWFKQGCKADGLPITRKI